MEEAAAFLILIGLCLVGAGPLALILVTVFYRKLSRLESRLNRVEKAASRTAVSAQPQPSAPPVPAKEPARAGRSADFYLNQTAATAPAQTAETRNVAAEAKTQPTPAEQKKPDESIAPPVPFRPAAASPQRQEAQTAAPQTAAAIALRPGPAAPFEPKRPLSVGGLELKIGTVAILIAGIITMIFGVGFFLRYVYEKGYFNPAARVALVAAGGLAAIIIGEVSRRRNFEIVARGIAALGFALLYTAVFSGSRVYHLFSSEWAFAFAIVITAGAMTYAVVLNEILIAFLSLVGGYLAPIIITTGQNLPVPLFSYVLALSAGAMGCAIFRRWRAVNWITLTGTWLLYTAWFEKFYTSDQAAVALAWLSVFAVLYMVLPILFNLVRRIEARVEDVVLVVVNGITVSYYLWQILEVYDRKWLACGAAVLGAAHLALMFVSLRRCPQDTKLHASLGVLGIIFISAALPMYLSLQASLVGWSVEAVALTYIGIRYRGIWTQVMGFLVAGAAAAGLFHHLPLHPAGDFRVFLNAPFGTWLFVSATFGVCHLFWRRMRPRTDTEANAAAQVLYMAAAILLAVGVAMEWFAHCDLNITDAAAESLFLKGMMVLAIPLVGVFFLRPLCPPGAMVRNIGIALSVLGAVFYVVAMMGVYGHAFKLFINIPFALSAVYVLELFWIAWRLKKAEDDDQPAQHAAAFVFLSMLLLLIVMTEQMYLYWFCRHEYADFAGDWETLALQYILITWAVYGFAALLAGIRFARRFIQITAGLVSGLSVAGLFFLLPLHRDAEFTLMYNFPFVTWLIVALAGLAGHALWRFMRQTEQSQTMAQLYYIVALLALTAGLGLEWAAHSRWHVQPALADAHMALGVMVILAATVQLFFARPLPPAGSMVTLTGAVVALGGCAYAAAAMLDVYASTFKLYLNWPFAIAILYASAVLLSAWHLRRRGQGGAELRALPSVLVLAGLILLWILLSEQVYSFWHAKHAYGPVDVPGWRSSAYTGISVTWGLYAAALMVIGFWKRSARVRWLSLLIFAVLLGKIFIIDIPQLRTEYRIAAFITTGLLLIGVSFLYQWLKNKGFFAGLDRQKQDS